MVGFKTFRALGKCRKTGIYGACIRPQGRLQNLSHKKNFNDITLQNDLSFLEVWERVFMNIFTQSRIRSKCNFMKRDENELVAKYSPYRAKLSTNITLQNGIKYMGLIQDQWSCPSKNNCKMACARESFHKAVVQREPLYVQANVWKIPSKEKERFFCRLSSFLQQK